MTGLLFVRRFACDLQSRIAWTPRIITPSRSTAEPQVFDPDLKIGRPGRLIAPDGQITDRAVQPSLQKYSGSLQTQITCLSFAIPAHTEGRFAIVTDVGQGMRWTRAALLTRALACGRRSRVVLTPDAGVKSVKEISPAMVANKPGHQGEHEGNR
jgi:hypothetical protein